MSQRPQWFANLVEPETKAFALPKHSILTSRHGPTSTAAEETKFKPKHKHQRRERGSCEAAVVQERAIGTLAQR